MSNISNEYNVTYKINFTLLHWIPPTGIIENKLYNSITIYIYIKIDKN